MDGILALDLWVVVIEVLYSSNNVPPTQKISTPKCKPQGAAGPLLTKGSFTRDEWCNVLCLVKILNLSLFSRGHFRSVEQATIMSKIIQERKMEGELAVAKRRSVCLISESLNKGQSSSFGPDVPKIWENPQLDSGSVKGARGKLQAELCRRSREKLQAGHCPKQTPKPTKRILKFGKKTTSLDGVAGNSNGAVPKALCLTVPEGLRETAGGGNMAESSKCCGKLQPKIEIQIQTTHHNLQVTDYGYVEKVFMNLRRKLYTEYTSWSAPQHTFS